MLNIRKEFPGILNWCIEGYLSYKKVGLNPPICVVDVTKDYRNEMDILGTFLTEECNIGSNFEISSKSLYQRYQDWCKSNGFVPINKIRFGMQLTEKGFKSKHTPIGNMRLGLQSKSQIGDRIFK